MSKMCHVNCFNLGIFKMMDYRHIPQLIQNGKENSTLVFWDSQKIYGFPPHHILNCMTQHASWGLASNWCHLLEGAGFWGKSEGGLPTCGQSLVVNSTFLLVESPVLGKYRCFGLFDSAFLMIPHLESSRLFGLDLNVKTKPSSSPKHDLRNSNAAWSRRKPFQIQRIQMAHWPRVSTWTVQYFGQDERVGIFPTTGSQKMRVCLKIGSPIFY